MPQLITRKFKVFKFKELNEEVQEKVIERERERRYEDSYYSEQIDDDFKEILVDMGLPTKTAWSLSNCQGDGVAFYGSIELIKFLKYKRNYTRFKKLLDNADVFAMIKDSNSNYCHSGTMSVYVDGEANFNEYEDELRQAVAEKIRGITLEGVEDMREELELFLQDAVIDVSSELEKQGYDAFEYYYSDDVIKEEIEDRDNQFLEDGDTI